MAEQVVDGQSMTGLLIKQAPGSKCEWLLSRCYPLRKSRQTFCLTTFLRVTQNPRF